MADSATGYVLNTIIYTGKEGPAASRDLAMRVVIQLMAPYVDKGYRLFVDNWYTNVPLFLELEIRGILACGTVRGNKKFLPKDIVDSSNEQVNRLQRGESLFRQRANATQLPDIRFSRVQFHYPVKTDTQRKCKVHLQRVETVYEFAVCQVRMCPAPCFHCYHMLQQYVFDDPERNNSAKRLKDVTGRPRAEPGRPPQRRSR